MMAQDSARRFLNAGILSGGLACLLFSGARLQAQGDQVIRACVGNDGILRAIGPGESCNGGRQLVTWSITGPAGPAGPTGATGPAGPAGPEGPAGRDGRDAEGPVPPAPTVLLQMTVDGMNGNNPTPIQSFTLGATNPSTVAPGSGGGSGKVSFQDLAVTKMLDGMSLPLLTAAATGQHIRNVTIEALQVGAGAPFATYRFEDVLVTADVFGSSGNTPSEQVSLNFGKIRSDIIFGGMTFHSCWDLQRNLSC